MKYYIRVIAVILAIALFHKSIAQTSDLSYIILESNPEGSLLAAVGATGTIQILNSTTGQSVLDISQLEPVPIRGVGWSPNGNRLALADVTGIIRVYCTDSDMLECTFGNMLVSWDSQKTDVSNLDWNPNGSQIITSNVGISPAISVWDVSTQQRLSYVPGLDAIDVEWSPNGLWIAYANADRGVGYIDISTLSATGQHPNITTVGLTHDATAVAWNGSSTRLAVAEGSIFESDAPVSITIWDITQPQPTLVQTLNGHEDIIGSLTWSADDTYLASIGFDAQVFVWKVSDGSITNHFIGPEDGSMSVLGITWVGNTHQIAYGGQPGEIPTITNALLPSISSIALFNSYTDTVISLLENGNTIALDSLGMSNLSIRVQTLPSNIGSVIFDLNNNAMIQTDSSIPYELTDWLTSTGAYTLIVTPYSGANGTGTVGLPLTITFNVICPYSVDAGNTAALISSITTANTAGTSQTLCLEGTYELTSSNNSNSDGANGLPVITGDVTLVGINGGATITRNSASQFRIAKVASGGRLVLNGITISNGNPGSQNGGGIRNLGTLEVIHSVITNNTSNDGGGIRNNDNATLIITGSTISNNTSTGSGGGVYSNTDSITTITDTDFINNQANPSSGLGGALFVKSPNLSISGGVFDSNSARNGGAIFFGQPTSPTVTLTGVSITNNTANNHGGGVYVSTGTVVMNNVMIAGNVADSIGGGIRNGANLTIQNNSMIQDNYGGDSQGGGIINYSSLTLHDTQLIGNYGDTATFLGGAIYNDGTLIIDEGSLIDGTSTTVSINARHGGGIYADGGTVTISDSQIVNNVANVDGGGIMVRSGTTLNATGVTLDNNTAHDDGGGLANEGTFTFTNGSIRNNHAADRGGGVDSTTATNNFIHYSCLEGNTAANRTAVYSGASNFDATNNWWGSTSGATSSQVNSNVVKTPFVNTNCVDAQAMGGGSLAAMQSSTSSTIQTVSAPYETIFDERAGWLRSGTWAQEANGGRASTGWVVDATIRNMISTLEMPVFVNLGNNPSPRVRYWQRGILFNIDTIVLEILPQGATTWTILDQQTNLNSDWTQREIDLSAYRGQAIRLRWRLTTDGDVPAGQSSIDYGIDDLQITSRR